MIYLTGASGFLGNAFYNKISSHYECVCLVRNPNKSFKHNVVCDLNDKNPEFPEIKSDAIVVHCASLIKGTKKSLFHTNVEGTKKLISWAKKNQIKKIIYISSLDVELNNTEYAHSKKQAEQLIINSNLEYVIIRPAVIFGKADTKNFGILNQLIVRFPLVILPNKGSFLWQPVHVDDCVNLMVSSLSTTNFDQQIITIVGPEKISFEKIVKQLIKATGKSKKIIKIPNWVSYLVLFFGTLCFQKNKVRSVLASFQTKLPSADTQVIKGKKSLQDEFCS